jgi:16S rRNA (cytosine967-C5)-methyltransferase
MKAKDSDVHALLCVGLYQLIAMRVPPYAAVTETVNAAKKIKGAWAGGLANAVLRKYLRESGRLETIIQSDDEARYAHPQWWIDAMKRSYPAQWQAILAENNIHPPFSIRVNQRRASRSAYVTRLQTDPHITPHMITATQQGLMIDPPVPAEELPGFADGDVFIQDGAAQLAAELLALQAGQRVLDACAAPGGKLTHILEIAPDLAEVVAVEQSPARLAMVKENLKRLHLSATCIASDVTAVGQWWNGQLFDRILVDAPCSASGVVRRHPDIKLLRGPTDIPRLAAAQTRLLQTLWPLLKQDGLLLYVTCSVFPEENSHVIQSFLSAEPRAIEEKILAAWGMPCDIGRQILPGMDGMDGFYYVKLRKAAA